MGENCVLKGYCYDHLLGGCTIGPGRVVIQDCQIEDRSCHGHLALLLLTYDLQKDDPAHFSLQQFQLFDLKTSLVRKDSGGESFSKKNLIVNELEITECEGKLGEPETFLGKGHLRFSTLTRKGIESTPFALPAEILSRLGLNSSIMTPVRGTAIFHIGHERCYISRLRDAYSQGKLSKFYISSSKEPSYIDFDGNVHLQVKIKHYNLLFKLSEMFTINVRGTLQKPLYYLQK